MDFKKIRLPINKLKILTRSEHYINVGEIFLEKVEFDKIGQEIRVYTVNEQAFEKAYERLKAYKKQQAVTPAWEREEA